MITTARVASTRPGPAQQEGRIEKHPDRHEEEDGEGVAHGECFRCGAEAEFRAAHRHAREESTQGHRHAEEPVRRRGNANGHDQDREGEKLAGVSRGDVPQEPRDDPPADDQHGPGQGDDLHRGHGRQGGDPASAPFSPAEQGRHENEDEHGEDVLDHQPPHGGVAEGRVQFVAVAEHPCKHDGAGDRHREPEGHRRRQRPAHGKPHTRAHRGR